MGKKKIEKISFIARFGKKSGEGPLLLPNRRKLIFSKKGSEGGRQEREGQGAMECRVQIFVRNLGSNVRNVKVFL